MDVFIDGVKYVPVKEVIENTTDSKASGLLSDNRRLKTALKEIAKAEGRYSMDKLTHASNTIDNMKKIANDALALTK